MTVGAVRDEQYRAVPASGTTARGRYYRPKGGTTTAHDSERGNLSATRAVVPAPHNAVLPLGAVPWAVVPAQGSNHTQEHLLR